MITRQMNQRQYESAMRFLRKYARKEPLRAEYEADLHVEGTLYRITFHPDKGYRMAALQAVKITRDESGERYELISTGALLVALAEIWLSEIGVK